MYTLIGTGKLNGIDPQGWFAVRHGPRTMAAPWLTIAGISDMPVSRLPDLLPWNWAAPEANVKAA